MAQVRPIRGPNGEWGAHGVLELDHAAEDVYAFMREVEDQPRWNAGVKLSEVVRRVSAHTTHVKQVLAWSFLALRGDMALQLAMTEEPAARTIRTELLHGGSMVRRFSSCVGVHATGRARCRLEMQMLMQPGVAVPWGVRHMVGGQVRRQLHGVLDKVKSTLDTEPPEAAAHRRAGQRRQAQQQKQQQLGWLFGGGDAHAVLQQLLGRHPLDIAVWG